MRTSWSWFCALLIGSIVAGMGQPAYTLDPNFNPIITKPGGRVSTAVIQQDGKIVIVGYFEAISGVPRKHIARLHPNGELDRSFAADIAEEVTEIPAIILQPDGKLIVARGKDLIRLHPDGRRDSLFRFQPSVDFAPRMLVLQQDGKILASGIYYSEGQRGLIARFRQDGTVDRSFRQTILDRAHAGLTVLPDGRILCWGNFDSVNGVAQAGLARLQPDGSLDQSFQHNIQSQWPEHGLSVQTVNILDNGRLIVTGFFKPNQMLRLSSDGAIDSALIGGASESLLLQTDGKMILSHFGRGISRLSASGLSPDPTFQPDVYASRALALFSDGSLLVEHENHVKKLKPRGVLDAGFSSASLDVRGVLGTALQQHGGKIVFTGDFTHLNGVPCSRMARIHPDGSNDLSFKPDPTIPYFGLFLEFPRLGVLRQAVDGKLLVAGVPEERTTLNMSSLIRLNPDGSRDWFFDPVISEEESVEQMKVRADGKILVALKSKSQARIVRLRSNGRLDPGFQWQAALNQILDFDSTPDGGVVVAGLDTTNGIWQGRLARFNSDGTFDRRFQQGTNPSSDEIIRSVIAQPDGKVIIASSSVVTRLNADGTWDPSFGSRTNPYGELLNGVSLGNLERLLEAESGFVADGGTVRFSDSPNTSLSVVLPLAGGTLLLAGQSVDAAFPQHFGLIRLDLAPRVESINVTATKGTSIRVGGQPDWTYQVWASMNLVDWTSVREVMSTGLLTEISALAQEDRVFYRVSRKR